MKQCQRLCCLRGCSIPQQVALTAGIARAEYGLTDSCYGFLDLDLAEYIRHTLPADYITQEEEMSRNVPDHCIWGTMNSQSAADLSNVPKELAKKAACKRITL